MTRLPSVEKLEKQSKDLESQKNKVPYMDWSLKIIAFINLLVSKQDSLVLTSYVERVQKLIDFWRGNYYPTGIRRVIKKEIESNQREITTKQINIRFVNWLINLASIPDPIFTHIHSSKIDPRILTPTTSSDPEIQRLLSEMRK